MRVQIAEATAFQNFDGRRCVFAEASQRLFELNDTAMSVLAAMDRPVALPDLYESIAVDLPGGRDALDQLLVEWSGCGLIELQASSSERDHGDAPTRQLGSPDAAARIHCGGEECAWFAPYAHLPLAEDGGFGASGEVFENLGLVRIEGAISRIVPRALLAATFRFHLVEALLARNSAVALHCAVLVREGAATVVMGPPGTGKSTMALFAAEAGFAIGCDDIAFLDTGGRGVAPLPLPLTLKEGSWSLAKAAGFEIDCAQAVRRQDGIDVLYLPISNSPITGPIPVRAIVKLERGDHDGAELAPWSATECLEHLCSEALSPSGKASVETFRSMLGMVEGAETLVLRYGEAQVAASVLESHVAR